VQRLQAAQAALAELREVNSTQPKCRQKDPTEVRASTTDPESRKMKMADGGFRPAYNVQFATTTEGGVVVGVSVTNEGTDGAQMPPMLQQIEERFGRRPEEALVDGGFATVESIDAAERGGTTVYAPPKEEKKQLEAGQDPYARKRSDTDATAAWRARMGTESAKAIYKQRASTAEWVNAQARNRDFYAVRVRGVQKVLIVALWYALAHNLRQGKALRKSARAGERCPPVEPLG
jgi:IS5 family transposase